MCNFAYNFRREQFYIPSRRHWLPHPGFANVLESFDSTYQLTELRWGNLTWAFRTNQNGRLEDTKLGR